MAQALLSQRSPGLVGTGGRGLVERVAAPAISDQMMGGPALDATGSALRPAMIHSDTRAEPQARALAAVAPEAEFYEITGNRLGPHVSRGRARTRGALLSGQQTVRAGARSAGPAPGLVGALSGDPQRGGN